MSSPYACFRAVLMIAKVYEDFKFIRQIEDLNDGVPPLSE
jgi:hypothetical protein